MAMHRLTLNEDGTVTARAIIGNPASGYKELRGERLSREELSDFIQEANTWVANNRMTQSVERYEPLKTTVGGK